MKNKEKAIELIDRLSLDSVQNFYSKKCALICVDRNINMFNELLNRMEHFSNESRQVIYQLIDDEEEVKQEIEKL